MRRFFIYCNKFVLCSERYTGLISYLLYMSRLTIPCLKSDRESCTNVTGYGLCSAAPLNRYQLQRSLRIDHLAGGWDHETRQVSSYLQTRPSTAAAAAASGGTALSSHPHPCMPWRDESFPLVAPSKLGRLLANLRPRSRWKWPASPCGPFKLSLDTFHLTTRPTAVK